MEETLVLRCVYWDERRRYCMDSKHEHERNMVGGYEIVCHECAWLLDALRDARGLEPWPCKGYDRVWPKRKRRGKGKHTRIFLRSAREVERAIRENPENPS